MAALADPSPATPTGGARPGLVTSAITSPVFSPQVSGRIAVLDVPGGTATGRGFTNADSLRHVRDFFGPAVPDEEWEAARDRSPYMAPNRALAAHWGGADDVHWTLQLSPGAVRIASHDPVARERAAVKALHERQGAVDALLRLDEFQEAVAEAAELQAIDCLPSAAVLADAWMASKGQDELAFLEGPTQAATRRNWELWCERVIDTARLYPDGELPEATVRGTIFGLSRKSRARMMFTFAAIDWTPLLEQAAPTGGRVPMDTLTYGRHWLAACPDGRVFHDHLDQLWRRHEKAWGSYEPTRSGRYLKWTPTPIRCGWKLEFQRRGAPHAHLFKAEPQGAARVPTRGKRPVGAGLPYKQWLSATWNHIVYGTAPCDGWVSTGTCTPPEPDGQPCPGGHATRMDVVHRHLAQRMGVLGPATEEQWTAAEAEIERDAANHFKAGTAVDYDETREITDPKLLAHYFAKHGSFADKRYQDRVPAAWQQAAAVEDGQGNTAGTGRIWGYKGVKKAITPVKVTAEEAVKLGRLLRSYCRAQDSVVLADEVGILRHEDGTMVRDFVGDPIVDETGRKTVQVRTAVRLPYLATDGGTTGDNRRRAARKGLHASPHMTTATVRRYEGGRLRLSDDTVITGLAGAQFAAGHDEDTVPVTWRKARRRAARFALSGRPSGWAIVADGTQLGSALAAALGHTPRPTLGLRDGLTAAGISAPPPVRPGRYSRTRAELRAVRDRYAARWSSLAADRPEASVTQAGTDDRTQAVCQGCGGRLATTVAATGLHVLCDLPHATLDDVPAPPEQLALDG
ncbi:hypothetical protein [Streptomyces noursei]|uniref:hypothetical protein n=1 Tax=Streptomyces noursei TaxID=1971 RepID=UPI0038244162